MKGMYFLFSEMETNILRRDVFILLRVSHRGCSCTPKLLPLPLVWLEGRGSHPLTLLADLSLKSSVCPRNHTVSRQVNLFRPEIHWAPNMCECKWRKSCSWSTLVWMCSLFLFVSIIGRIYTAGPCVPQAFSTCFKTGSFQMTAILGSAHPSTNREHGNLKCKWALAFFSPIRQITAYFPLNCCAWRSCGQRLNTHHCNMSHFD